MEYYPLKFEPLFKERIWGGQQLAQAFGKDLPDNTKIGESWELVDLPGEQSVVSNGPWKGLTLSEVLEQHSDAVLGPNHPKGPFPLLVKLLDAQDILSVQVHPDEETCARTGKGDAKTECWYIVDAQPGATIYKGLKPGVTRADFEAAVDQGTTEDLLQKVVVQPGECHFLPAGTVHAIGAGLLIAEIQMPSDTTYRLFDFNRIGADGSPRELHIEDGLESIHFDQDPSSLTATTMGRLVDCKYFKLDKGHLTAGAQMLVGRDQMSVIVFLSGSGALTGSFTDVEFKAGDCILTPQACDAVLECQNESHYLVATL